MRAYAARSSLLRAAGASFLCATGASFLRAAGSSLLRAARSSLLRAAGASFLCATAISLLYSAGTAQAAAPARALTLQVDARDAPRHIFHVHQTLPARPGPITLVYPKWIPGEHAPTGPITQLTGLKLMSGGISIPWQRDAVDMYAFHLEVPKGATQVDIDLDFVASQFVDGPGFTTAGTPHILVLSWNTMVLYPQGRASQDLTVAASLRLPAGWKYGTALEILPGSGDPIDFKPVSLTTLVDSPVLAGDHFRVVQLDPPESTPPAPPSSPDHRETTPASGPANASGNPSHELDIAADSAAALELSPAVQTHLRQLIVEANTLFGAHHYHRYHFLLALSDRLEADGLEHHESSDNRMDERVFLDEAKLKFWSTLLPHEYTHSWNGKYRRPTGLATPDFQQPMKDDLLWVYEGLTEYIGNVLTTRSGLWTAEEYRDALALSASDLDHLPGRSWRPLADTAIAAQLLYTAPYAWASWRRGVDFYTEGALIWLEVDALIRQRTEGRRSLDDFCRRFHGGSSGGPALKPYTLEEVVSTLNEMAPYDWKNLLMTRLKATSERAPLGGIEASGWRLIYNDSPTEIGAAYEEAGKYLDYALSLGLWLKHEEGAEDDGLIRDTLPGSPAAKAGLSPGVQLVAVNGRRWTPEVLHEAVKETKGSNTPLELLVSDGDFFKTYAIDYHDGLRYPHLERIEGKTDLLELLLKPLAPSADGNRPAPAP